VLSFLQHHWVPVMQWGGVGILAALSLTLLGLALRAERRQRRGRLAPAAIAEPSTVLMTRLGGRHKQRRSPVRHTQPVRTSGSGIYRSRQPTPDEWEARR
jgi:CHASE1-domain containing sensor protein